MASMLNYKIDDIKSLVVEHDIFHSKYDPSMFGITIEEKWDGGFVKGVNLLNATVIDKNAVDRTLKFELYMYSYKGYAPTYIIDVDLIRLDDCNEFVNIEKIIYHSLDEALKAFCDKVNAAQVIVEKEYSIN